MREGWEEEDFYADLLAHLDRQGKGYREEREKQSVRKLKGGPLAPCQEGKKAAVDQGICCRGMLALRSLEKFGPLHLSSLTTFTGQSKKSPQETKEGKPKPQCLQPAEQSTYFFLFKLSKPLLFLFCQGSN